MVLQPTYLFADSQLLFWTDRGGLFLQSIRNEIVSSSPKAAYLGASNGDVAEFYSIFQSAMNGIGIQDTRRILSRLSSEDEAYLNTADIILLSGGDAIKGWEVFSRNGLREMLLRRYYEGSVLIGVSAGAVQLGLYALAEIPNASNELVETLKLVPFMIATHEEKGGWKSLTDTIRLLDGTTKGIGISSGGGMIFYPDRTVEAIRHSLTEFSVRAGRIERCLLAPPVP